MRYISDWYGKTVEVEDSEYIELRDRFPEYLEGYGFSKVTAQFLGSVDYTEGTKWSIKQFLEGMKADGVSKSDAVMLMMLRFFMPSK